MDNLETPDLSRISSKIYSTIERTHMRAFSKTKIKLRKQVFFKVSTGTLGITGIIEFNKKFKRAGRL